MLLANWWKQAVIIRLKMAFKIDISMNLIDSVVKIVFSLYLTYDVLYYILLLLKYTIHKV